MTALVRMGVLGVPDHSTCPSAYTMQLLRRVHHAYVDLTANPFFTYGAPIRSDRFDAAVEAAVAAFGKT